MEFNTLEKTVEELKKISGKVRGEILLDHADYIKEKEGGGGLKKLEKKLEDLGAPLRFKNINPLDWYNESLSVTVILVAKEIFYWKEEDIFEMGESAPRFSLGLKMLTQNLILPKRLFEESPVYWKNIFNFGSVEPVEFDEEKEQAKIRIKEYKTHPLICTYHAGYLKGLAKFALKEKTIDVKQEKCVHKGDSYNEYIIKWKT